MTDKTHTLRVNDPVYIISKLAGGTVIAFHEGEVIVRSGTGTEQKMKGYKPNDLEYRMQVSIPRTRGPNKAKPNSKPKSDDTASDMPGDRT